MIGPLAIALVIPIATLVLVNRKIAPTARARFRQPAPRTPSAEPRVVAAAASSSSPAARTTSRRRFPPGLEPLEDNAARGAARRPVRRGAAHQDAAITTSFASTGAASCTSPLDDDVGGREVTRAERLGVHDQRAARSPRTTSRSTSTASSSTTSSTTSSPSSGTTSGGSARITDDARDDQAPEDPGQRLHRALRGHDPGARDRRSGRQRAGVRRAPRRDRGGTGDVIEGVQHNYDALVATAHGTPIPPCP